MTQPTTSENIRDIYPLSPMQKGILFHNLFEPELDTYFKQMSYSIRGELDLDALRTAWQWLVDRHDILRTFFVSERDGQPLQVVRNQVPLPWAVLDFRGLDETERRERLEAFLEEDTRKGFELDQAPLMRISVVRLGDRDYRFVWCVHHIVMDGWCQSQLVNEVMLFYEAARAGRKPELQAPKPYKTYIKWLERQDMAAAERYWRGLLQGAQFRPLSLRNGPRGDVDPDYRHASIRLSLRVTSALEDLARDRQLTLNTLLQGAWAMVVGHHTQTRDVVFGATVSGRPSDLEGVETMIGLFINTLPVRIRIRPEAPLLDWLAEIQDRQAEQRGFEYTPLYEVRRWRSADLGTPLFDNILVFENIPEVRMPATQSGSLEVGDLKTRQRNSLPFTLLVGPEKELLLLTYFDLRWFDGDRAHLILRHLANLLEELARNPRARLADLQFLNQTEVEQARECAQKWRQAGLERFKSTKPKPVQFEPNPSD